MAIEKNFVVKNGLEVNANLILADANLNRVGIATTTASYTLHVNGGIGATDIYVSGVTTSNAYLVDGTQVISSARQLQNITSFDATTSSAIESVLSSGSPITLSGLKVTGVSTFVGLSTFNNGLVVTSGIATFGSASATNLTTQNLNVSGIGTVTTLSSTNGIVTNLTGTAGTITTLSSTNGTITNLTGTAGTITDLNSTSATLGSLFVQTNVLIDGNLSVGGTTSTVFSQTLRVKDSDIILGITTDANNEDISTDITANHGGIAIASTEGTPLVNLTIAGLETAPATYKKIMWFKSGSFTGLNTDAWLTNYGVGIGSTQVPDGVRLAVDEIQLTKDTVKTRNLSVSGVGTIPTLNSTSGTITNLSGTIGTVTTLESTNGTITNLSGTIGTIGGVQISSGIITASSGIVTYYGDGQYLQNLPSNPNLQTVLDTGNTATIGLSVTGIITATGFSTTTGTSSQFLKADGSVDASTYLQNVVEDITPQLGGDLDVNGKDIIGTGQINLTGIITATSFTSSGDITANGNIVGDTATNISGINSVTATTYYGDGSQLSGISGGLTISDDTTTNSTFYPTFTSATSGTITSENVSSTKLTFNPSTGTVTATTFSGALSGNATSATNATNINVVADNSTNATHYPVFTGGATGNQEPNSDTSLTYNPSTNILTAGTFSGALSGNATSAATLQTARTINGVSFNGSANIVVNPTSGAYSNGYGARTVQSGGSPTGGSDGDIYYIY